MKSIWRLSNIVLEFKYSFFLALPLITSEIIYALNNFFATMMVAHLSKAELAANALVWNIYMSVILFFIGVMAALCIMVAQSYGAKDDVGAANCFKQGLIVAIIFSLPMMLTMILLPEILPLFKQDPAVIAYAKPFFYSLTWSMLPLNIIIIANQFLVGITKTKIVMLSSILAIPTEIFFYYAFLFGQFGLPQVGLKGIGYGLAIAYSIIAICLLGYLGFSAQFKKYQLFKKWWLIKTKFLFEMFRIGFPLGLMWGSEIAFMAAVAIMIGTFGVAALSAFQITQQFETIALVILLALSQSTGIRVGHEVGRANRKQLKLSAYVNLLIGFILAFIFSLCYICFPEAMISLDININAKNFQETADYALKFLPLMGVLLIADTPRIIFNGALRGLKDSNFQLFLSVFGFWLITLPMIYWLTFKLGYGPSSIWWSIIIGFTITGLLLLVRFNKLAQKVNLDLLVTRD